jgi:hypothetical protein
VWPWCSRLCQSSHSAGDTTNGRKPIHPTTRPTTRRAPGPRTTPPCSVSCARNVIPAKLTPSASETTGTSIHGNQPPAIATMPTTIAATCAGNHHRRERAGANTSGPSRAFSAWT